MTARATQVADHPRANHLQPGRARVILAGEQRGDALAGAEAQRIDLPYRDRLEERFGRPLDGLQVYSGPAVRDVLAGIHAVAASRGQAIFLAQPSAPIAVVAHEVAHALQSTKAHAGNAAVERDGSPAEREAARAAAEAGGGRALAAPVRVAEGIGPQTLALLRMTSASTPASVAVPTRPKHEGPLTPRAVEAPTQAATTAQVATPAPAESGSAPAQDAFTLPAAPELTVSAEQVAAREAALAEAEAVIAAASTSSAVLDAYAAAPPTLKARRAGTLGAAISGAATEEAQEWQADLPDLHASMSGAEGPAEAVPVLSPPAGLAVIEEDAVAPAPEPEITDIPDPGPFEAAEDVTRAFNLLVNPEPAAFAEEIGESLDAVPTTDIDVPRSAGPPPAIPLGGETDPARIATVEAAGHAAALTARGGAAHGVIDGPGPERVQPRALDEPYAVGELAAPVITGAPAVEGPEAYLAMELPPEVQVAFDEQQRAAMEQSMGQAVGQAEQATAERDTAKQSAVAEAEAGVAKLNEEADGQQTAAVAGSRTQIQAARQQTLDAQHGEVERVETEAADQRRLDEGRIETRLADDQKQIDDKYIEAEGQVAGKVAEGERQAEAKKAEAERDAENESWWDRAVSFVKDAFNALIDAIGAVFDLVRSAVNGILDAVKAAALLLIDGVASFIEGAIAAFGEILKFAITGLIGEIFPELAAKLNGAIDSAVATAQAAVDTVADGLKAGVSALVEGLRAGLNAAINAFQAGITLAVSFAAAAITGDWGALARRVLESVLRLIGVAPETFYAFVGRAEETFQIIIDDPLGFIGNLVNAVTGGFQRFADHIGTHLQSGVIGWLTGALGSAGLSLPATFDLMGVLDLARQILGLTWDLLKAKARKIIGEQNVERLQTIYGYIETLVVEGWGGLWAKIMTGVSTIRDLVFEGIKSFLLERVVIAAITKLATLFNPVGAIVQLVLTAWNLYTFLRDKLAQIIQVVQSVTEAIGDIARGVLDGAMTRVEGVLGGLVPLALDLLARLLGLGNVGDKVREIVEQVRALINRAIDTLLERVLALFKGGDTAAPAKAAGGAAAPGALAVDGANQPVTHSPTVKDDAMAEAAKQLTGRPLDSIDEMDPILDQVFQSYRPMGLTSLAFDVTEPVTLQSRLVSTASAPEGRTILWEDIFKKSDSARRFFKTQKTFETYAAFSFDGRRFGEVATSVKASLDPADPVNSHHAEVVLFGYYRDSLVDSAREYAADPANAKKADPIATVALAINRAPCTLCAAFLVAEIQKLDPALKKRFKFVLAPTGLYEPSETLSQEDIDAQKEEIREAAERGGVPADAAIEEQLTTAVFTEYATKGNDLKRLVDAGWDLVQFHVRKKQVTSGRILAEVAEKLAKRAEAMKGGPK